MGEENEGSTKCICLFSLLPSSEMAFARLLFWGFQGVFPPTFSPRAIRFTTGS